MKTIMWLGAIVPLGIIRIFLAFSMVELALSLIETVQNTSSTLNLNN